MHADIVTCEMTSAKLFEVTRCEATERKIPQLSLQLCLVKINEERNVLLTILKRTQRDIRAAASGSLFKLDAE